MKLLVFTDLSRNGAEMSLPISPLSDPNQQWKHSSYKNHAFFQFTHIILDINHYNGCYTFRDS